MMTLPANLIPPELAGDDYTAFLAEVQEVWVGLVIEHFDPDFTKRTHGNHKTYQAGCRGPHCTMVARQVNRKYTGTGPSSWSEIFEPIVIYLSEHIISTREKALKSTQKLLSDHAFTD